MEGCELWSIKKIAQFLDLSENYTRNYVVKQDGFPKPRYVRLRVDGRSAQSKPRWFRNEVVEWASQAYLTEDEIKMLAQKKQGRPRKAS